MIANNLGAEARRLAAAFPGRVGHLYGPGGWKTPRVEFPYALDNGAFPAWQQGRELDAAAFRALCARAAAASIAPRWVAVPDVVLNPKRTAENWRRCPLQARLFAGVAR